ncbi:MAG: glycoside hydrolase family 2 [Chloroflexota bacterium]|nr:glycoside hydrolase family 2 [Chloroflexota bacterium]
MIDRLALAPNPQFARDSRVDLCGEWSFGFDDEDVGRAERWFIDGEKLESTITVPYPPESKLSGIADTSFHPVCWYARSFADPRTVDNGRLILHFGAVDYAATVWVDGVEIGGHEGGQTPFSLDATDALEADRQEHLIVVRAFDDPLDVEQPRGKQDWLENPHSIFYHRTTGIWQPVWFEVTPERRILSVRWRFDRARWHVDFEVELSSRSSSDATLTIELDREGQLVAQATVMADERVATGQIRIGQANSAVNRHSLLWSPSQPTLLGATITLSESGSADDQVLSYVGLRTVETAGRRILINGSPVFLRFVLEQGYWPESHLASPSANALEREVDLIKELGFNGARIHQKVEDPRLLFWADRKGLLLWGEAANAFTFSDRAIQRHASEWREAVLRDRNHPSIIAWVPFNESWGISEVGASTEQQQAVKAAYPRTHQLDGTRPVIGNDGWENVIGDLLTLHDYSWESDILRQRYSTEAGFENTLRDYFPGSRRVVIGDYNPADKPVLVTEFGGVSYAPESGEEWFGYGTVQSEDEFIGRYRDLCNALHESELLAGFCYTQLTDTEQETNGLLTEDRQPKAAIEKLREITSGEA